jgi:uncharacterized Rmd1/YagE family protein
MRVVPVHALGIAATLRPRDVAALFGWLPEAVDDRRFHVTKTLALARYDDDRYVVVHDFGAVVFFDFSKDEREAFMAKLLASGPPEPHLPLVEDYLVEVRPGADASVKFDRVVVPSLDATVVEILSLILAQSVAMDYYEEDVRAAYARVEGFATSLVDSGRIDLSARELNRFVGNVLAVRNQIAMTLSLLDEPLETWEHELYDRLYRALRSAFEIEDRHQTLEYKLRLIQENLEIMVNLAQSRRGHLLEGVVIALIAFEIALTLFEFLVLKKR